MLKRDDGFSGMKTNQNNPPFIWRKAVPGRRVNRVLELPRAIHFFIYIPLRNVANSLHEMKEKVGSAFVMVRSTF